MNIRALCTDIDGTLLDSQKQLSKRTISAIQNIQKHIPIILASSRMPSAMVHLQEELGIVGSPLICYNGGFVIQYKNGNSKPEVFDSVTIAPVVCQSVLDLAENTQIHVSLYFEDEWYAPMVDQWTEREERITKVKATIADPKEIVAKWMKGNTGGHKLMCMGPEDEIKEMSRKLNEKHADDIHVYFSRPTYLELAPKKISKASALELILQKVYSIPMTDVIAFGDNYNDIEMLRCAGLGIAVENAREEAKQVAKKITLKSIEDGVAHAIEQHL
jgi:Cof subfamily protein (haloacid dehalogenase superfamily)